MEKKKNKFKYSLILVCAALILVMGVALAKNQLKSISLNSPATFPVDI